MLLEKNTSSNVNSDELEQKLLSRFELFHAAMVRQLNNHKLLKYLVT